MNGGEREEFTSAENRAEMENNQILGSGAMIDGFYAIYYTGRDSSGHMSLLIQGTNVVGMEASGGIVRGSCTPTEDGGALFSLTFNFEKGTQLVTGQTLSEDLSVPFSINVHLATINGEVQKADFPTGPVNFRLEKLASI